MLTLPAYENKVVGVMGLGKSGAATVDTLLRSKARVVVWDDNDTNRSIFGEAHGSHVMIEPPERWDWAHLDALMLSPGIPLTHPKPHAVVEMAKKHKVRITGDVEMLLTTRNMARSIGITGTNGKSTTTSLIGHILQHAKVPCEVGGNLGKPVLSMEALDEHGCYVLELSSYQLDLMDKARIEIALLLNFSPDHIDRHGDMAGYIAAKKRIFQNAKNTDVAIVGVDDAYAEAVCRELIARGVRKVVPISTTQIATQGVYVKDAVIHNAMAPEPVHLDISAITSLRGEHNWQNAAAAYAACYVYGVPHEVIAAAMQTFPGLAHRMQWLGELGGVQYVNDSKATNADATEKALKTYDPIYWILGGMAKEGGIEPLAKYFPRIRHAFLIGKAADEFAHTLQKANVPFTQCGTLDKAFAAAKACAEKESPKHAAVLLSPACASFDQYKNFEQRGDAFMKLFHDARGH